MLFIYIHHFRVLGFLGLQGVLHEWVDLVAGIYLIVGCGFLHEKRRKNNKKRGERMIIKEKSLLALAGSAT